MRTLGRALPFVVSLLLGACGGPASDSPQGKGEPIELRGPGVLWQAWFDGRRLSGPNLELARFDDGLRGRALNTIVSASTKPGEFGGQAGNGTPIRVEVTAEGDSLLAKGLWAGRFTRLAMTADDFEIAFQMCGYDFKRAPGPGHTYRGRMTCGQVVPQNVELSIPEALLARPPEERAFWLIAFFAR